MAESQACVQFGDQSRVSVASTAICRGVAGGSGAELGFALLGQPQSARLLRGAGGASDRQRGGGNVGATGSGVRREFGSSATKRKKRNGRLGCERWQPAR